VFPTRESSLFGDSTLETLAASINETLPQAQDEKEMRLRNPAPAEIVIIESADEPENRHE
jgi:hypothetical protein